MKKYKYNIGIKITKEGDNAFFAESIKTGDHFSQGRTKNEAIANFIKSLSMTVDEHLKRHGHIKQLKGMIVKK